MEELTAILAEITRGREAEEAAANQASKDIDAEIEAAEMALSTLKTQRDQIRAPHEWQIAETEKAIERQKQKILEAWDGEKKTIVCPAGTLKFRTTQSLRIDAPGVLLTDMIEHLKTGKEIMKYISGYNKTAVKKYLGVHSQPASVAEIESKTAVRLE